MQQLSIGSGPAGTLLVAGNSDSPVPVLIQNVDPANIIYIGDDVGLNPAQPNSCVPLGPGQSTVASGNVDVFGIASPGLNVLVNIYLGVMSFFQPVGSITIPTGATTGQRIVIDGVSGTITGYNAANLKEFIISPSGYLIYDATGGALNHLFIAIKNIAGTDEFTNPFDKGIQVGPQTGPQVLVAGGNPAYVAFPLNDAAFSTQPSAFAQVVNAPAPGRFAQLILNSAILPLVGHRDWIAIGLNSPNANGTSSANTEIDYIDDTGGDHAMFAVDRGGVAVEICQQITASDPSHTATSTSPAIAETWHDMRPLSNSFVGTNSGFLPPQFRKAADGTIQFAGYVRTPPTTGNYNNVAFTNIPAAYRPPNVGAGRPQWCVTDVADGVATPKIVVKETGDVVLASLPTSLAQTTIGIWGGYPLGNTGQILT